VDLTASNDDVELILWRLANYESALKNRLINTAITSIKMEGQIPPAEFPDRFLDSKIGGGRCVIQPRDSTLFSILSNPADPRFAGEASRILAEVSEVLNRMDGLVKLTPDFGRFGMLADLMYDFTPHVLGIGLDKGGCGGKSSYSATGVMAAASMSRVGLDHAQKLTLIGSNGAMGTNVAAHFLSRGNLDIALCDVAYDDGTAQPPEGAREVLPSHFGRFTRECLRRGNVIVATTVGNELINSAWQAMPRDTVILMAHNLALPPHYAGLELARRVHDHGVTLLPGQVLTLGGALTSRLEWFWRQGNPGARFPKPLAHKLASTAITLLVNQILSAAEDERTSPYEVMLRLSDVNPQSEARNW
ncbi:MAG TPA: hypothetical protein VGI64_16285, partial [Streptosporangiaceae bacterium]